jgi:hypothetical protein
MEQVIAGWTSDPKFLDRHGRPKPLDVRGVGWTFDRLVKKYGRDVTSRTLREELTRRGIAEFKGKKLVLLPKALMRSQEATAALADLKFLVAHIGGIEFRVGQRSYTLRKGALTVDNPKSAELLRRVAVSRLETVLNSLADISIDLPKVARKKKHRPRRLLISAIVATEAED